MGGFKIPPAPPILAVFFGIAIGGCAGLINGALITSLNLPPFLVTLGTLVAFRGLVLDLSDGTPISPDGSWTSAAQAAMNALKLMHFGTLFGFSPNVWLAGGVILIGAPLLHFTILGRYAFAIGSNERTARLCGVKVNSIKPSVTSSPEQPRAWRAS